MKSLKAFIEHCMNDSEFWDRGGIPTKEEYYIKKLGMTEEEVHLFYEAMSQLYRLNKDIEAR